MEFLQSTRAFSKLKIQFVNMFVFYMFILTTNMHLFIQVWGNSLEHVLASATACYCVADAVVSECQQLSATRGAATQPCCCESEHDADRRH